MQIRRTQWELTDGTLTKSGKGKLANLISGPRPLTTSQHGTQALPTLAVSNQFADPESFSCCRISLKNDDNGRFR